MVAGKKVKKEKTLHYCTMQLSQKCEEDNGLRDINNFYTTEGNPFYKRNRVNVCKDCLKEYIYVDGEENLQNFKKALRVFDFPFIEKDYISALNDKKETVGMYLKNIYLNHKNKTWEDGDLETSEEFIDYIEREDLDEALIRRWGYGYTDRDYEWLEEIYAEWINNHECEALNIRKLVQSLCMKELEIRKKREVGEDVSKLEESYMKLMDSAKLTPKSMGSIDSDNGKTFGVWLKDIEKNRPAEFFADKKIYHDYDGIYGYFENFILRPMKNLLIGTREFSKEFSVEHEDEE